MVAEAVAAAVYRSASARAIIPSLSTPIYRVNLV
jgi:hypothetical protein